MGEINGLSLTPWYLVATKMEFEQKKVGTEINFTKDELLESNASTETGGLVVGDAKKFVVGQCPAYRSASGPALYDVSATDNLREASSVELHFESILVDKSRIFLVSMSFWRRVKPNY